MPTAKAILRVAPALLLVCLAVRTALGQGSIDPSASSGAMDASHLVGGRLPAAFLENLGQIDPRARFYTTRPGLRAFFTSSSMALQLDSCEHAASASVFLHFEGASP